VGHISAVPDGSTFSCSVRKSLCAYAGRAQKIASAARMRTVGFISTTSYKCPSGCVARSVDQSRRFEPQARRRYKWRIERSGPVDHGAQKKTTEHGEAGCSASTKRREQSCIPSSELVPGRCSERSVWYDCHWNQMLYSCLIALHVIDSNWAATP
jgi:hypothetical protein